MAQINYTNKSFLNRNADIPDFNKVTDNDMNEIKSVVNENDTNFTNFKNQVSVYQTNETTIGTWIDSKPIYRRVFTGTKVSGTDLNISAPWASSIDTLITLTGTMKAPNTDYSYPLQRYESSSIWSLVNINRNTGQVRVASSTGNYSNGNVVIIVEYTKTTD